MLEGRAERAELVSEWENMLGHQGYVVELTATGPLSTPHTIKASGIGGGQSQRIRSAVRSPRSVISNYGPKYVFECSYCGKKFTHQANDSKLGKHKDKHGYPCPGRTGYFVTTKY
jgi:hypothetical protein